jgi:hypothetical protein
MFHMRKGLLGVDPVLGYPNVEIQLEKFIKNDKK